MGQLGQSIPATAVSATAKSFLVGLLLDFDQFVLLTSFVVIGFIDVSENHRTC